MSKNNPPAFYDALASEYYDVRHETSRNFDQTTAIAASDLKALVPPTGLVLDVGCGKGRVNEYLGVDLTRVIQLDNSKAMLEIQPREAATLLMLHEAETLPFIDDQFACVAGFLCDPFFGLNFLAEAYRILKEDGLLVLTIPSYEWGQALRSELKIDSLTTRFLSKKGESVIVPSNIVPARQIGEMLKKVGFAENKVNFRRHRLPEGVKPISADIIQPARTLGYTSPHDLDILYSIAARK